MKMKVELKVQMEEKYVGEECHMQLVEHECGGQHQECIGPQ